MPLHPLLQGCLAICQPLAEARGVVLQLAGANDADDPEATTVPGDPMPLPQIMANLLSNGIKYNRAGGHAVVSVNAERAAAEVEVTDSGPGLAPEQLEQLFQPFNRLAAENTGIEGHGPGLAISRAMALSMGGDITARSEPGQGTRFTVRSRGATTRPAAATADT